MSKRLLDHRMQHDFTLGIRAHRFFVRQITICALFNNFFGITMSLCSLRSAGSELDPFRKLFVRLELREAVDRAAPRPRTFLSACAPEK